MRAHWARSRITPTVPNFAICKHIPQIIHQTVPDKNKIPADIRDNMANISAANPRWRHMLYDNEDIRTFILLN